jgi:phosphatidylserine decarboxylase
MTIHKEGFKVIPVVLFALIIFNATVYLYTGKSAVFFIIFSLSVVFITFNFWFFRDPQTVKKAGNKEVLSVSDGKVVVIEPVFEKEYFQEERLQVSVFMSVTNVHINHVPVKGKIVYQKYHPGKFMPAYAAKSSGENERCTTVIRRDDGTEILIRQIAGILARRIVTYRHTGDEVDVNDQLGFIRFGSRVDLFLPVNARVNVSMNQMVKGGITVIAKI